MDAYDPDSVYGRKKSADGLGIEEDVGEKPSCIEKRGSVDPKNISGRDDLKEDLPEGKVVMTLVKAKDLIKSDLIGKSDPSAMLTYGLQQHKTPVGNCTQDPVWNNVVAMDGQEGRWFPLAGAKSGQILLMSDFVDNSRKSRI